MTTVEALKVVRQARQESDRWDAEAAVKGQRKAVTLFDRVLEAAEVLAGPLLRSKIVRFDAEEPSK